MNLEERKAWHESSRKAILNAFGPHRVKEQQEKEQQEKQELELKEQALKKPEGKV